VRVLRKECRHRFETSLSFSSYWHQVWVEAFRNGFASLLLLTHQFYQSAFESNRSRKTCSSETIGEVCDAYLSEEFGHIGFIVKGDRRVTGDHFLRLIGEVI
jgi:hypothetical protein